MAHSCSCGSDLTEVWRVEASKRPLPVTGSQTVAEIARTSQGLETLKQWGINHCCGAALTLSEAAAAAGVPIEELLGALNDAVEPARDLG